LELLVNVRESVSVLVLMLCVVLNAESLLRERTFRKPNLYLTHIQEKHIQQEIA
jgi:hypothetical protein